jgi:YD repeat-containing protein
VNLPNTYIPSVTASNVAAIVQASRADVPGNPSGDIQQQVWTNSTSVGQLTAVSVHTAAEPQDGNINLAETDLRFASPGARTLRFVRYYQSSWLGGNGFGPGWRYTPFELEFQNPSWYDQTFLMKDTAGNQLPTLADSDTCLRGGAIRLVNLDSGSTLDFNSSLSLNYAVDVTGNPIITVAGLAANDMPTFTPGQRQNGATLVQLPGSLNYQCTLPNGESLIFDHDGHLLQSTDRDNQAKFYVYDDAEHLLAIGDSAGQSMTLNYDPTTNYIVSVAGPANEQVVYAYTTNGCLATATHVRSGAHVSYAYNTNSQLIGKTLFNGQNVVQAQPDLKGRATTRHDYRGNSLVSSFTRSADGTVRTTTMQDPLVTGSQYTPTVQQRDRAGRLLSSQDNLGNQTTYGYNAGSLLPNTVALPIAGRPPITIRRDSYGKPTRISDPGNVGAQDVTATYDPNTQQLTNLSDELSHVMTLVYNANHHVSDLQGTHNGQIVDVNYAYDAAGGLSQVTDPLGNPAATFQRDGLERVTSVADATGVSVGCSYDNLGRVSQVANPCLSSPVAYHYDNFTYDPVKGWLTSSIDLLGRETRYDRNPTNGDVLQVVQVVPGGTNLVTVMSYDRFGNLASVTPPGSATIDYNYDALGRAVGDAYSGGPGIPGAPTALVCNHATNGLPAWVTNLVFSWQPPVTSAGLVGYSYGFDQMPGDTVNNTGLSAAVTNITLGTHLFQVKAQDTNGNWGPTADFQLIINWEPGDAPPGAPLGLVCNVSSNGVPAYIGTNYANNAIVYQSAAAYPSGPTAANIVFSWQIPTNANGIAGYSWAWNATPSATAANAATNATFAYVAMGSNLFEVMAEGSNGVWGPVATFPLVLEPFPPYEPPSSGNAGPLPPWSIILFALGVFAVGAWFVRRQHLGASRNSG